MNAVLMKIGTQHTVCGYLNAKIHELQKIIGSVKPKIGNRLFSKAEPNHRGKRINHFHVLVSFSIAHDEYRSFANVGNLLLRRKNTSGKNYIIWKKTKMRQNYDRLNLN